MLPADASRCFRDRHTSGLSDQWALLGLAGWRYSLELITDDDVIELMSRQKDLNFQPGEKHVYCNRATPYWRKS